MLTPIPKQVEILSPTGDRTSALNRVLTGISIMRICLRTNGHEASVKLGGPDPQLGLVTELIN